MKAEVSSPKELFDGKVHYEIPTFQRPYVWDREDQWEPLWQDVQRTAESVLAADGDAEAEGARHFLGAVVLKQLPSTATQAGRFSVIDGQQRLTTLQLLLDAAEVVVSELGLEEDAGALQDLILNDATRFQGTPQRFKLWPSRIDRPAFEYVMDNSQQIPDHLADSRIQQAHDYFRSAIRDWAREGDGEESSLRLSALTVALVQGLQIVEISLSADDDDQVIFETLNDRGTPLLAADLIKNYVFQKGEELHLDVEQWADDWEEFDDDWWRTEVAQGRLLRSRIDMFLQYWLTMRLRDEIPVEAVFKRFRSHAAEALSSKETAADFLEEMLRDAETFREFAQLDPALPEGRFYERVVEALELGASTPLLLWLVSDNHRVPEEQAEIALAAFESWVVRRTLLRRTMSNLNRIVVQLLQELDQHPQDQAGDVTRQFLLDQSADTSAWPSDSEVRSELPTTRLYGSLKQQRLRMILQTLEETKRSQLNEDVTINGMLEIEHIMPTAWRIHWMTPALRDPKLSDERDRLVNTLGNLTLVTSPLNKALSNRPWKDGRKSTLPGKKPGKGKRTLITESLLSLNADLAKQDTWDEEAIRARAYVLCELAILSWPRPDGATEPGDGQ